MEPNMEYCLSQVLQKDVARRLQMGPELIDFITDADKCHDLESDQTALDKMVDGIAMSWVNSSNFKAQCVHFGLVFLPHINVGNDLIP